MTVAEPIAPRRRWPTLLLAAVPVVAAALIGNRATLPAIPEWYAGLAKPGFTPPNWLFGPAWTTLYVLMTVAFARILRLDADVPGRGVAITLFLVQMALNAFWSVAFFGWHSPGSGLVVIAALDLALVATILAFRPLDRWAAVLLLPYLAWIAFATALNAGVFLLNR